jgi:hypothetical protein
VSESAGSWRQWDQEAGMSNRSSELNQCHSDGQKDGASGDYHPPHSITPLDHLVYSDQLIERMDEDNKAYDAGWTNAYNQR